MVKYGDGLNLSQGSQGFQGHGKGSITNTVSYPTVLPLFQQKPGFIHVSIHYPCSSCDPEEATVPLGEFHG